MPYDKYQTWPFTGFPWGLSPQNGIKSQVLKDLDATKAEIERLEILDSFEAYVKRYHQQELAGSIASAIVGLAHPFITAGILGRFPSVTPVHRGRPVQQP